MRSIYLDRPFLQLQVFFCTNIPSLEKLHPHGSLQWLITLVELSTVLNMIIKSQHKLHKILNNSKDQNFIT